MKYFLISALMIMARGSFAQDCTPEMLAQKPGSWKAGQPGMIHNLNAADAAKEKLVLSAIHKMIASHYQPTGCQVTYSNSLGKEWQAGQNWVADPFHLSMYILRYLCDPAKKDISLFKVDISTPTTVTIAANVIYWLDNLYAADLPSDHPRGFLKLKQKPVRMDGYFFMGEEVVGDAGQAHPIREYRWLITYGDTLPFSFLTRKEYLQIQRKKLEQDLKDSPGETEYFNRFIRNIDNYLSKPESELQQPAICTWNEEERFEKFAEEGQRGTFFPVIPNRAYYPLKTSMSSPRFFTVVYKIATGDPVFEQNMMNMKKAVDFDALKNMLGK